MQTPLLNLIGRASIVLRLFRLLLQPIFKWLTLTFTLGARRAAETFSAPKQNRLLRLWIGYLLAAGVLVGLGFAVFRSEEHTSELQSHLNLVCRLLLEKKNRRQQLELTTGQ